jgi:putative toxin-antitoxin system antitoxin component (TIGR02293 family)
MQEWARILHLDARTLQRYRVGNLTFAPLQSEKILEIKILNKMGIGIFGDAQRFDAWLDAPNIALGGTRPKDLLDNAFGIALIKDDLIRIQYGVLA